MLVITAQVWPGGNLERARWLGSVAAANVTGRAEVSDYLVVVANDTPERQALWVPGHRRSDGWEPLVARVLTGSECEPPAEEWDEVAAGIAACVVPHLPSP